ncbi:hypothetical protein BP6252_04438 [Coleophoma cylindrospora]|uniref:UBA domain-containing protein n=1 Tax=Coleophoma cylindrospora TaxID=1849047 RepID=A0A3D8S0Z2_9HELO|nr:hypothetical protein BP6252_04438 [Coleophoma cylindrospora]
MSGALSKRQQARNERTLQDLIKTVPGNNVCADCQARNPGWASWSNMKRVGNIASNKIYNPQNSRPPIPIDADEADSAMERFIRQKYQQAGSGRTPVAVRNHTGSSTSDDHPPPLPPKTGGRFGFRSASSIFPLSSKASKARREAEATAHIQTQVRDPSPPRNKPSRVFGTSVDSEIPEDLETKMAKLRDMGFKDEKRNIAVLKGLGGNMDKTIETLVRLGEGGSGVVTIGKSPQDAGASSRPRSPLRLGAGLSINRTADTKSPPRSARSVASSNPFDALDAVPAQPQSSQSTGALSPQNPYSTQPTTNPFGFAPSQSQLGLNQAFQNMALQPSQPLFPNHTGGFPAQQPSQVGQLYQQSMTPPVPSIPQQNYPSVIYENPGQQPAQQNYNPFMQQQQQQPQQSQLNSNPYAAQQQISTPQQYYQNDISQYSQTQQQFQGYYDTGIQQSPQPLPNSQMNPFFQNAQQGQASSQQYGVPQQTQQYQPQGQYDQFRQQTYPAMGQQQAKPDKHSILELYNYPQLAPTPMQQQQQQQQQQQADPNQQQTQGPNAGQVAPQIQQQQQANAFSNNLATHMAGSRNPFGAGMAAAGGAQAQPARHAPRHVSQESISADSGGWMNGNGRHSPDAFAGLSARSMR